MQQRQKIICCRKFRDRNKGKTGTAEKKAERTGGEERKGIREKKNQKFYTSTGNKYKDPSLMGYDELQRTLANVKENKDLFKSRIADSGLFKQGFSGEWEKFSQRF